MINFPFGRICNPTALNISICSAINRAKAGLKILIFTTAGLQIQPNGRMTERMICPTAWDFSGEASHPDGRASHSDGRASHPDGKASHRDDEASDESCSLIDKNISEKMADFSAFICNFAGAYIIQPYRNEEMDYRRCP